MAVTPIPELFRSEDIVYHYTNVNTAVEYILAEQRLRLSPRKNSNDPIENIKPVIPRSEIGDPFRSSVIDADKAREIDRRAHEKIAFAKQICFCKNDEEQVNPNTNPKYPLEYFGFLRPRMWDQYGNKYKGVCLAFSLKALKKAAANFHHGEVEYLKYNHLERVNFNYLEINVNRIEAVGLQNYWEEYSSIIEKTVLRKHIDYKGEHEYRFLSYTDKKFDYINIENCLRGIIMPQNIDYMSEYMRSALKTYAEKMGIERISIYWSHSGIDISDNRVIKLS
jgi:hypothetical protein